MALAESDLCELIENIWSSVLGLEVERSGEAPAARGDECLLTGCVQVRGAWDGAVILDCSAALAREATALMFGVAPDAETFEDVQDALGELANIVGGNVKSLLPQPCELSLPTVVRGLDYTLIVPGSRLVAKLAFRCHGEPLAVSILKRDEQANPKRPARRRKHGDRV